MVLSIVIPVYNELEAALLALLSTLRKVLANLHSYEVIFVDDGSRDGSSDALRHAAHTDPRLKVPLFSRIWDTRTRPQSLQAPRAFST